MITFLHTSNEVGRLLKRNIYQNDPHTKKDNRRCQGHPKNPLELEVLCMYKILRELGEIYVGQTGRTSETRCKEHRKLALAEHSISTGDYIDFSGTSVLDRSSGHVDLLLKRHT
jgi:hypothetical protein